MWRHRMKAWIAADPFRGGFRILITGPHELERSVAFRLDEDTGTITQQIRAALEE